LYLLHLCFLHRQGIVKHQWYLEYQS
jgi:hypothetical protein